MNKLPTLQDLAIAHERTKAIIAEQHQYFDIAFDKYRDNTQTILSMGDYTPAEQYSCIAECAYILEHKQAPEWGYMIERFEIAEDGSVIFIHRDKGGLS